VPGEIEDPALGGVSGLILEQALKDVGRVVIDWTHLFDDLKHVPSLRKLILIRFTFWQLLCRFQ
jgi:hypothetical protein